MEILSLLVYPFIACVLLIGIHAYFGVHVLERGIIFVDLSMAQFIALGIAVSFLMGGHDAPHSHDFYAVVFAFIGALILSISKRISRHVNIEAFIGVMYVFSLAASLMILDRTPHGLEEFEAILNGNILWVTKGELVKTAVLYGVIGLFHFIFRKRFFALSYEGKGGVLWEFLFFLSFALVLTSSVSMAGVLQVFSFLVIPALIGKLFTKNPTKILIGGWAIGVCVSILCIAASYHFDIPTAPLIVASLGVMFFTILGFKILRDTYKRSGINADDN
ncbi:metal ABC transporter permease [Candidatus Magnetominusculus dajiuhuensis]|uniref:metal ABC transporter permease n=1 Tax=Candidatus Magnetominusculus dajiuhuensis TaxID=3137712 RepID=UPI003B4384DF